MPSCRTSGQSTVWIRRAIKVKSINNNQNSFISFFRKYGADYIFALPFCILFFLFTVFPVVASVILSFTNFNAIQTPQFIGMSNYINLLLDDGLFLKALKNTLILSVITGPGGFILSLAVAWMLNELGNKTRAFITLLFYGPSIAGGAYTIWQIIYSGDMYGFLNSLLIEFGIINTPIQWLTDTKYMMPAAIVAILWLSFGTGFLSLISGFKNVDKTLYEAAAVDGIKNRYQELWYVTLPMMKPQLTFSAVMTVTSSFGMGGIITAIFGFPSSGYALHTLAHHMQDYGNTRFEMGYASSIAVILFVLMVSVNGIVQRMLKKIGG